MKKIKNFIFLLVVFCFVSCTTEMQLSNLKVITNQQEFYQGEVFAYYYKKITVTDSYGTLIPSVDYTVVVKKTEKEDDEMNIVSAEGNNLGKLKIETSITNADVTPDKEYPFLYTLNVDHSYYNYSNGIFLQYLENVKIKEVKPSDISELHLELVLEYKHQQGSTILSELDKSTFLLIICTLRNGDSFQLNPYSKEITYIGIDNTTPVGVHEFGVQYKGVTSNLYKVPVVDKIEEIPYYLVTFNNGGNTVYQEVVNHNCKLRNIPEINPPDIWKCNSIEYSKNDIEAMSITSDMTFDLKK